MASKIVLISDDSDFFEYMKTKLELRKSDELFAFSFDELLDKIHFLESAVIIVNSESSKEKTLELLNILKGAPIIVSAFNDDDVFKRKCYRVGMFDYITLLTPDSEFRARMLPALSVASLLEKNKKYREILVKNKIIAPNNEVFLDYSKVLDKELEEILSCKKKAVLVAVSPVDSAKFLISANAIETIILNNIRKNDILMNYAPNKYFMLLFDTDIKAVEKLWAKIMSQMPQKIYAGYSQITNQKKEQLVNEVLSKLHQAINSGKSYVLDEEKNEKSVLSVHSNTSPYQNFKLFRQEFGRKIEQVITPVFYQIQQMYSDKILGVSLEQGSGEGYGCFYIKGKHSFGSFRVTSPGFSKINIDITYQKNNENIDAKRITLEPEELEQGLLSDLLEQFILEYKRSLENDFESK